MSSIEKLFLLLEKNVLSKHFSHPPDHATPLYWLSTDLIVKHKLLRMADLETIVKNCAICSATFLKHPILATLNFSYTVVCVCRDHLFCWVTALLAFYPLSACKSTPRHTLEYMANFLFSKLDSNMSSLNALFIQASKYGLLCHSLFI